MILSSAEGRSEREIGEALACNFNDRQLADGLDCGLIRGIREGASKGRKEPLNIASLIMSHK